MKSPFLKKFSVIIYIYFLSSSFRSHWTWRVLTLATSFISDYFTYQNTSIKKKILVSKNKTKQKNQEKVLGIHILRYL